MKDFTPIKNNINEHRQLIESIKRKGLYSTWEDHIAGLREAAVVKIKEDDFINFEHKYDVSLPAEIKYFYTAIGTDKPSDLYHEMKRLKDTDTPIWLDHQYSEKLAEAIVKTYCQSTLEEKASISEAIKSVDKDGSRKGYESDLNFLLWEGTNFYNRKENIFSIPFLDRVYKTLASDTDLVAEVFLTWSHCGGAGGIILNTERRGCHGGVMFGSGLKVQFEGQEFEYYSNCHKTHEDYYLRDYDKQIEFSLAALKKFANDKYRSLRQWFNFKEW